MSTFTPFFWNSATAASRRWRKASSQWCVEPLGAVGSTTLQGAMSRTKFAPIEAALSYTSGLELTATFTPRSTTGEPVRVSRKRPSWVVTQGGTAFAARCGSFTRCCSDVEPQPAATTASPSAARRSLVHMAPVYGPVPGWEAGCHTRPMKSTPEALARAYVETITRVAEDGRDEELLDLVHPAAELRPIITGDVHR